jgi:murein DD-endopeptidase MepM/ murein hydrolase activator NlpD
MSDNGRYAGENSDTGAAAPVHGAPLTRRQLRKLEAAAAIQAAAIQAEDIHAESMRAASIHSAEPNMPSGQVLPAQAQPQAPTFPSTVAPPAGLPLASGAAPQPLEPFALSSQPQAAEYATPAQPQAPQYLATAHPPHPPQPYAAQGHAAQPYAQQPQGAQAQAHPERAEGLLPSMPQPPYLAQPLDHSSSSSSSSRSSTAPTDSSTDISALFTPRSNFPSGHPVPQAPEAAARASYPKRGGRKSAFTVPLVFSMPTVKVKKPTRQDVASKLLSMGAMIFAAALLVGTTVPANAFMSADGNVAVAGTIADVAQSQVSTQTLRVSTEAVEAVAARDSFTVTSYAELLRQKYGNVSYSYAATSGAVRWPFPFTVPISSGFGDRVAPCRGCSSKHMGLDFTPGAGSPIYSIADGVVAEAKVSSWGYGNSIRIDHVIKGQKVQTLYAHMQMNSSTLLVGDEIKAGDFIGLVGSTGASTGAHLHFEVLLDDVQVNPYTWLKANATNE